MTWTVEALRPLLFDPPIAHRGLWTAGGAPENSIAAFVQARAAGYGVELDVRLSGDGQVVVFHDADLHRMTGVEGEVGRTTAADLHRLRLKDTSEGVPLLRTVLEAIGPGQLVLIECKTTLDGEGRLEAAVADVLDSHRGPAAVIGFDPATHIWFAAHRPEVPRGLNSYAYGDPRSGLSPAERVARASFANVDVARPDFILPGLDILSTSPVAGLRASGLPVVAWTVRTADQRRVAQTLADNIIFEGEALL